MFEIGRLCMKIAGREAGKYCVVVKKMDEKFVMITGPKELTSVKRRRCNVNHLEPMIDILSIKSDAPDSDVLKAYQEANLTRKLGLEPGAKKPAASREPPRAEPRKAEVTKGHPKPRKAAKAEKPKAKAAPKKADTKPKAPAKPKAVAKVKKAAAKKAPAKARAKK